MATKRPTAKRRKKTVPRRRKSGRIVVEHDNELRLAPQAVLTTTRRIKGKIEDETDPQEQRRLRRLLNRAMRKVSAHREVLEELALTAPQLITRQLVEQISTFALVEDEFRSEGPDTRNSTN